ncbi:MAG: esterase-like activity of phytase family protein [Thiomargarita sp.]|nr:esterase-like activity of phytase family protein [Thiomargarita sp.]
MWLRFLFYATILIALINCGGDSDDPINNLVNDVISTAVLSEDMIDVEDPKQTVNFQGGNSITFEAGMGSGIFHFADDSIDEFYAVTNRGPSILCQDSGEILGVEEFCVTGKFNPNNIDDVIIALPDFVPTIYKFNIDTSGIVGMKVGYEIIGTTKLSDRDANPISGLLNPLSTMAVENAYDNQGNLLNFDPQGVNPKALVKLSNDTFWIADEYASSLVHVTKNGLILERIVPEGVEIDLAAANYRVLGLLPEILKKRAINRGIESLAISPNEQFLYFMLESPLANPNAEATKNSRYVRLFKVMLQQGDFDSVIGEYIYILDEPDTFLADNSTDQRDVRISEMVALDTDELIILERIKRHTKLYRVNLSSADNILGSGSDIIINNAALTSLETSSSLTALGITAVDKILAIDSRRDISDLEFDIEGFTILNDKYAVFMNNNRFGIDGVKTRIRVAEITEKLKQ